MTYLNRDQQEQVILMTTGMGVMELLADNAKFKSARGDLRRAVAFAKRALDQIQASVDQDSFMRLRSLADRSDIILKPLSSPQKSEIVVKMDDLYELQSAAIHNHCTGCQVKQYKKCKLRDLLMQTHCPPANESKSDCQYRQ